MGKREKSIDQYIAKSADFAKPILTHLRELVHGTVPEVEEKMKWGFPHFDYKGGFCNMAAFKGHSTFGFWKQSIMVDPKKAMSRKKNTLNAFDRLTSIADLPSDKAIIALLNEARKLNDDGIKVEKKPKEGPAKPIALPRELLNAIKENKSAAKSWDTFSPSKKKDYAEWIAEAKTEATKEKRIAQAVEWIAEGKSRNWKYEPKR